MLIALAALVSLTSPKTDPKVDAMQAKQFRDQQRLGLSSQDEFQLDTSTLAKRKADMAGVAAWPEEQEGASDDDFDADGSTQVSCQSAMALIA